MRTYQLAGGVLALLLGSASAIAQTADPAVDTAQTAPADPAVAPQPAAAEGADAAQADQAADDKKWKFYTLGYVWLATAKGKTDVIGPLQPVDLDLSLGDVIDGFKFIFMGAAEARKDRFVILGDLSFVHLGVDQGIGIRDPDFLEAELDSRTAEITLLGGYRVINESNGTFDLLAGGRLNFFKTSLQLQGPNRSAEGAVKEDWLDPLIGARAKFPIGGKWGLSLYGDVGGVIFGSDITWQGLATVDYQISRKMNVGVGWRHWKVNYDHGDFLYNVRQTGPIIAFRSRL
ncbi:MAG TPA: hypothetical protein VFH89_03690 [Sphingomicrobium sp.]|nr:hypothetical protein [Sphingomicrobium sp.]